MAASNLTPAEFSALLKELPGFRPYETVAVGVSGGPDSMTLAKLLSEAGITLHALIVDHNLRRNSGTEAKFAAQQMKGWKNTQSFILKWSGKKPKTRILEAARKARYDLMARHCRKHKIPYLLLAHHADDQFETVLFRLAKGSGLDGLSGMKSMQAYDDHLTLLRPFLNVEKDRLIATCKKYKIKFAQDPTNENEIYMRPRMRAMRDMLAAEGFTAKRMSTTVKRLRRAREALDQIAADLFDDTAQQKPGQITLHWPLISAQPAEIALRVLIKSIQILRPGEDYLPRMEKIEAMLDDLLSPKPFRKRTLGGLVFERKNELLILKLEMK